jgi:transcription initiation factor TFIIIB Brf1 subunit/transcription initiation factor TFIIB
MQQQQQQQQQPQLQSEKRNGISELASYDIFLFIQDVCENAGISNSTASCAYSYYKILKKNLSVMKKKFIDRAIAAYALYKQSCKETTPRNVLEISYFTGIPSAIIFKIDTCFPDAKTLNSPQEFVHRYCSLLNISFYDSRRIKEIVENMYGIGNERPNTLVAAIIYLYCKEFKIKLSMKAICIVCAVSAGNIYKIIRDMRKDFKKNISLLYSENV